MNSRYIIFVIDTPNNRASALEMAAIDEFNEQLQTSKKWVIAAGIAGTESATVIDARENINVVPQSSLVNGPENYSGFWIIETDSEDAALEISKAASKACNRRVELRPFLR